MVKTRLILFVAAALTAIAAAFAAIPQQWSVDVSRVQPYQFQAYHGDTMELKASFYSRGQPFDVGAESYSLYWQTNGMGSAYWSAPAVAVSNTVSATFTGAMDPGAPLVYGFLGATGGNYRASFAIRFAASPGATPNELPLPTPVIDFAKVEVLNAPFYTKSEVNAISYALAEDINNNLTSNYYTKAQTESKIVELAPAPGNYAVVSNRAMNAIQSSGGNMTGSLFIDGSNVEMQVGNGGIDDQHARLSRGQLQVSDGAESNAKLAQYQYDKIQVTANGSTHTLTLPLETGTLALLSDMPSIAGLAPLASPTFTGSLTVGTRKSGETVGVNSVAEGDTNTASGECSHSEGSVSTASGRYSHAENMGSVASGNYSHAEGGFTTAQNSGEHSQGAFNDSHKASTTFGSAGNTLSSIGFGSNEDDRKNAVETMQDGKTFIYGLGGYDGTNPTGSGIKDLATAVGEKAPLASPAFTGTPTAPTPTSGDNSTNIATTAYVMGEIADLATTSDLLEVEGDVAAVRSSVTSISNDVSSISALLNAENARFISTNYNSVVHMPEAYVEAKIDGTWLTIWSEMTRWNWFLDNFLPTNYYTKAQVDAGLADKADRAWGYYDAMTGDYAPDDTISLSARQIVVCAGASYQRVADSSGYWVLTSNGLGAQIGGNTNDYFRISDTDGVNFEIVAGDSRTVYGEATTMVQVMGVNHYRTVYPVENAVSAPTAKFSRSLGGDAVWYDETDAACPFNTSWENTDTDEWTLEWWPKSSEATGFLIAYYEQGGQTYIRNVAPTKFDGGILCTDGVHKVRPVYNNGTITWEVMQ